MELLKIDPKEFYRRLPWGNLERKLKVRDLAEEIVQNYVEANDGRFRAPKGVTREVVEYSVILAALYKIKDNPKFVEEVIKKILAPLTYGCESELYIC